MTKALADIIDRIQGAATSLKSVRSKIVSPPPAPGIPSTDVQPVVVPPEVSQEDWDHAKKIAAELKGQVETLEAELVKESKVPGEVPAGETKSSAPKSTANKAL